MSALLALDLCLPEIFGAHVEESESRASAPESAGTVDSPDRGDAESAEVDEADETERTPVASIRA